MGGVIAMSESAPDALLETVKSDVGRRLKYARTHHPNGRLRTQAALSEATGVSRRALGEIEAGTANPSLDTLVKLTAGLGVERVAYLLDEGVFDQVNSEFDAVRQNLEAKEELGVSSVVFRADSEPPSPQDMGGILRQLQKLVTAAQNANDHDGGSPRS
ncbi:helix-turn-helix domain-containing protein [Amycolatopsis sp. TNS106]|uniref:helix-turn-helix domain-containing protein n=1 Tax=Amycolatopsis sp. TNS106 TaxID=2861750 RepID=UPI001C58EE0C|nr:helix-turn-helix transcriptional regulator [Amycolatopsis sp. TNS106]